MTSPKSWPRGGLFVTGSGFLGRRGLCQLRHAGLGDPVDIHRRESQEADQEEIANNDQDATVHEAAAKDGVAEERGSGATVSRASASMSKRRRTGRSLKILKTETKMTPKAVEE